MRLLCALMLAAAAAAFSLEKPGDDLSPDLDQAAKQSNRTASNLAGSATASLRGFISLSSKESKSDECQDAGVDIAILLDSSDSCQSYFADRSKPLAQAVARKALAVAGSNVVIGTFGRGYQMGEELGSSNALALEDLLNKLEPRGGHTDLASSLSSLFQESWGASGRSKQILIVSDGLVHSLPEGLFEHDASFSAVFVHPEGRAFGGRSNTLAQLVNTTLDVALDFSDAADTAGAASRALLRDVPNACQAPEVGMIPWPGVTDYCDAQDEELDWSDPMNWSGYGILRVFTDTTMSAYRAAVPYEAAKRPRVDFLDAWGDVTDFTFITLGPMTWKECMKEAAVRGAMVHPFNAISYGWSVSTFDRTKGWTSFATNDRSSSDKYTVSTVEFPEASTKADEDYIFDCVLTRPTGKCLKKVVNLRGFKDSTLEEAWGCEGDVIGAETECRIWKGPGVAADSSRGSRSGVSWDIEPWIGTKYDFIQMTKPVDAVPYKAGKVQPGSMDPSVLDRTFQDPDGDWWTYKVFPDPMYYDECHDAAWAAGASILNGRYLPGGGEGREGTCHDKSASWWMTMYGETFAYYHDGTHWDWSYEGNLRGDQRRCAIGIIGRYDASTQEYFPPTVFKYKGSTKARAKDHFNSVGAEPDLRKCNLGSSG